MEPKKLIALDEEDLAVLSLHLQDAVLRVGDMAYVAGDKRFAAVVNRFDWERAKTSGAQDLVRKRAGLRFERVSGAEVSGIDLTKMKQVLSLLAVTFEAGDAPSGAVTLLFSGGGAIRLKVECIEAELKDLGAAWQTKSQPSHPESD